MQCLFTASLTEVLARPVGQVNSNVKQVVTKHQVVPVSVRGLSLQ